MALHMRRGLAVSFNFFYMCIIIQHVRTDRKNFFWLGNKGLPRNQRLKLFLLLISICVCVWACTFAFVYTHACTVVCTFRKNSE